MSVSDLSSPPIHSTESLHGLLKKAAKTNPDKTALVSATLEVTYGELDAFANQFGNELLKCGVVKGDL